MLPFFVNAEAYHAGTGVGPRYENWGPIPLRGFDLGREGGRIARSKTTGA